jgi:hypothetical protein
VLLRHARIPIPPAGRINTKSPGTLRLTRARRELPAMVVARRSPPLGARACPPRLARRLPAVACRKSVTSCASSSFQRRAPNRVDAPETKRPGALARSGPRERARCATRFPSPDALCARCITLLSSSFARPKRARILRKPSEEVKRLCGACNGARLLPDRMTRNQWEHRT